MTIQEIRHRYPNPSVASHSSNGYCVGGALCLRMGLYSSRAFPGVPFLIDALITIGVPRDDAEFAAGRLTMANDQGDFETAWQYLEYALSQVPVHLEKPAVTNELAEVLT